MGKKIDITGRLPKKKHGKLWRKKVKFGGKEWEVLSTIKDKKMILEQFWAVAKKRGFVQDTDELPGIFGPGISITPNVIRLIYEWGDTGEYFMYGTPGRVRIYTKEEAEADPDIGEIQRLE